jgi:hypothetical protein
MQGKRTPATAICEDCGKRVQTSLWSAPRYPQGVLTSTGYICGECMSKRHEDEQ